MFTRFYISILLIFCVQQSIAYSQDISPSIQTGAFSISNTPIEILGQEMASSYIDMLDQNEQITWEIYVPTTYDANKPSGIMVYISPQNSIKTPNGWMDIMEQNNLIWVAATQSGNKVMAGKRVLMAVMALPLLQKNYAINGNRIYVSGLSGGGRVASIVATQYPNIFKGGIYNCGSNFWGDQTPTQIDLIKQNRFVFVTGSEDFNLEDTKSVRSKYRKAGVENTKLMVIPRMGHQNPNRRKFTQAIKYLDENKAVN